MLITCRGRRVPLLRPPGAHPQPPQCCTPCNGGFSHSWVLCIHCFLPEPGANSSAQTTALVLPGPKGRPCHMAHHLVLFSSSESLLSAPATPLPKSAPQGPDVGLTQTIRQYWSVPSTAMSSHTGHACMQEPRGCGRKRNGTETAKMTLGREECYKVRNVWMACFLQRKQPSTTLHRKR